jgi:hypothetical protein
VASLLLVVSWKAGNRAALERFDWRAIAALRNKNRKKWDAVKQLIRYKEIVGREAEITADSIENGELFLDPAGSTE